MSATAGRVRVNLVQPAADLLTTFGAGALIHLDDSATEGGSYSNVTTEAIVSGTEQYEIEDATATSATWFKVRVSDSGSANFSDYSSAVLHTSKVAYATLDELRQSMDASTTRDPYLAELLIDATEMIDAACGRRFVREPQVTGTDTYYVDIVNPDRQSLLHASMDGRTTTGIPLDIVSISTFGIRDDESDSTYTAVTAGDTGYYLDPLVAPWGFAGEDWPYGDVVLSVEGTDYTRFPTGKRGVEIVGALGFPKVPRLVKTACLDLARELYRQGPGGGPSQQGINQFGVPVFLTGTPLSFRTLTAPGSPYVRDSYHYI